MSKCCVVLKLGSDKYWIGETGDPESFIQNTREGKGSRWTRKYGFVDVDSIVDDGDNEEMIIALMRYKGIDNVRGTSLPGKKLPDHVYDLVFGTSSNSIYVLRLSDDKYYVGKTNNVKERLSQHRNHKGAKWTAMYPPLKKNPIESYATDDLFEEDRKVKELMDVYGINNVRGGSYSNVILDDDQVSVLKKELRHARDLCVGCGDNGHWIKNCPNKG